MSTKFATGFWVSLVEIGNPVTQVTEEAETPESVVYAVF